MLFLESWQEGQSLTHGNLEVLRLLVIFNLKKVYSKKEHV